MTVTLQALAIKSKLKVAMRSKNFKAVAMMCKNNGKPKAHYKRLRYVITVPE